MNLETLRCLFRNGRSLSDHWEKLIDKRKHHSFSVNLHFPTLEGFVIRNQLIQTLVYSRWYYQCYLLVPFHLFFGRLHTSKFSKTEKFHVASASFFDRCTFDGRKNLFFFFFLHYSLHSWLDLRYFDHFFLPFHVIILKWEAIQNLKKYISHLEKITSKRQNKVGNFFQIFVAFPEP